MPNLGAGVDQHVNPAATPTWVFTPTPGVPASVRFYNEGAGTVYVGQANVSQYSGIPILPGNRPVEFQNMTTSLYACSSAAVGANTTTLSAAVVPAGNTSFTVTTTAGFVPGTSLILGNVGKGQEIVTVATTTATVVTLTGATLYDHAVSSTVSTAVVVPAQLRVTAGVV